MNTDWESIIGNSLSTIFSEYIKPLIPYIFTGGLISLPIGAFIYKLIKKR